MLPKNANREAVLDQLEAKGGLRPGVVDAVHRETGVPAADIYGVATFYHLVARPDVDVRVCQGLSCQLFDCAALKADVEATGSTVEYASCLGRCDQAPALWRSHGEEPPPSCGVVPSADDLAIDLAAGDTERWSALPQVVERGPEWLLEHLEASGLSGRGGAGFPAHIKWRGIRDQAETERYVVLNADEGEPGTFKDREVMLRRPHLVIEGLAIAAHVLEADDVYIYVRGEFPGPKRALVEALAAARARGDLDPALRWHFVDGHGAYICGEETALLEALEGKARHAAHEATLSGGARLPRQADVDPERRDHRVRAGDPQSAAASGSSDARPYRARHRSSTASRVTSSVPGSTRRRLASPCAELLELAGGVALARSRRFRPAVPRAVFCPPIRSTCRDGLQATLARGRQRCSARPGSWCSTTPSTWSKRPSSQAVFFEDESCGQCSPCRIGTQMIRQALERYQATRDPSALDHLDEVMWGMGEASICGLGQAAFYPLRSAIQHFPAAFGRS